MKLTNAEEWERRIRAWERKARMVWIVRGEAGLIDSVWTDRLPAEQRLAELPAGTAVAYLVNQVGGLRPTPPEPHTEGDGAQAVTGEKARAAERRDSDVPAGRPRLRQGPPD